MYEIKKVRLQNKDIEKVRLVIQFEDERYHLVGQFLMSDAPMLNFSIINTFKECISQDKTEVWSGNRTYLRINKNETIISDLLLEDEISVSTDWLYDLVYMWKKELSNVNKK